MYAFYKRVKNICLSPDTSVHTHRYIHHAYAPHSPPTHTHCPHTHTHMHNTPMDEHEHTHIHTCTYMYVHTHIEPAPTTDHNAYYFTVAYT